MAALLYLRELGHARHLWRRTATTTMKTQHFSDWWAVGQTLLSGTFRIQGARLLQQIVDTHPAPLNVYAKQVQEVYNEKQKKVVTSSSSDVVTSRTSEIVAFLETRKWNA